MNIKVETLNEIKIASIDGRIDSTNSGEFEKPIIKTIDDGCLKMIVDCSGLSYISSSGLRVFLAAQKKMKALSGTFLLCGLQPAIKEVFDIAGFSLIFKIFPERVSALNSLSQ